MNYNVSLGIVVIVAAMTLTAVTVAIPQQALAYRHHNHNNHNNSIKVDQQINQLNNCTGPSLPPPRAEMSVLSQVQPTVCVNQGDNQADIKH